MIELEHVSFAYADQGPSVQDVSFRLEKGEFAAILGANGAGKTTTVRLMDGLLKPTSGRVLIQGVETVKSQVSERAAKVGFLFQNPDRQICKNTVREEILFGLRTVRRQEGEEALQARTDEVLKEFSFTGDEERRSAGAQQVFRFLEKNAVRIRHLFVLDVTDMGWDEGADFTIENNFWHDNSGRRIIELAEQMPYPWRFVPSDCDDVPYYVPRVSVINEEAEEDESWLYDELNVNCCSFCLPVKGEMHSDRGVLVRETAFQNYTSALREILCSFYNTNHGIS